MSVDRLSGLVLAGGTSRRMGTDKALITIGGEPLVVRAARVLSTLCDEVLVASGDGRRLDLAGVPQVADVIPGVGPIAGLVAGLEAARHPLVAVLAVDMPNASAAVLRLLCELWQGEPAVVARVGGRLEPLHALYARDAAAALRSFLASGRRRVREALSELGPRVVERAEWALADPAGTFAENLNRPEDLPTYGVPFRTAAGAADG